MARPALLLASSLLLLLWGRRGAYVRCDHATEAAIDAYFQAKNDTDYVFAAVNAVAPYGRNGSTALSLARVSVSAECRNDTASRCQPSELICEVLLADGEPPLTAPRVLDGQTVCAAVETHTSLPSGAQGYTELYGDERREVAHHVVQQLEADDPGKSVVDILSLKRQDDDNGTSLYLTAKVTTNDGGDTPAFEMCEWSNETTEVSPSMQCFSLEANLPDILLDGDDVTEVARDAVQLLDSLSPSRFVSVLVGIQNAEKVVIPGSDGVLTTVGLVLAPTLCIKRLDEVVPAVERTCEEDPAGTRFECAVTWWDRPWLQDVLHSAPVCQLVEGVVSHTVAVEEGTTEVAEEVVERVQAHCTGCPVALNHSSPDVDDLVERALAVLDEYTRSIYRQGLARVIRADRQVVKGIKYTVVLVVGESTCLKGAGDPRGSCSLKSTDDDDLRTCGFEFLERPWEGDAKQFLDSNCTVQYADADNEIEPYHMVTGIAKDDSIFDYIDDAMDLPGLNDYMFPDGRYGPFVSDASHGAWSDTRRSDRDRDGGDVTTPEVAVASTARTRRDAVHRPILGSLKDVEDAQLAYQLADVAVGTLDDIDADDLKRVLVDVISAKQQLVNGVMYHLKLRVKSTSCKEDATELHDCNDAVGPLKICDVQLHKAFVNTSPNNIQVVKAECSPDGKDLPVGRDKRQTLTLRGGLKPADVNREDIKEKAAFALQELDALSEWDHKLAIVRIINASTQVVAGSLTHLTLEVSLTDCLKNSTNMTGSTSCSSLQEGVSSQICTVKVLEQPWLDVLALTEHHCGAGERERRDTGEHLVGAPHPTDVNDPYIQEIALFATSELTKGSDSVFIEKTTEIVSAHTQVVAGSLIRLVLRLQHTNCVKGVNDTDLESCEVQEGLEGRTCTVEVWDRPWLQERVVQSQECESAPSRERRRRAVKAVGTEKRQTLVGGLTPADVNREDIRETAAFALQELDALSEWDHKLAIVRIINASTQVVAGSLTHLTLEVGLTDCLKNSTNMTGSTSCSSLQEGVSSQICTVKVLEQPWLDVLALTEHHCSAGERERRDTGEHLVGAPQLTDVNDPYIQEIALFATSELTKGSDSAFIEKTTEIVSAHTQVVAGSLIRLVLRLQHTNCVKGVNDTDLESCEVQEGLEGRTCTVEVWDRPWLQERVVQSQECESAPSRERRRRAVKAIGTEKRQTLVGGLTPADVNREDIRETAAFALQELDALSEWDHKLAIVRIINASTQVVAGSLTHLTLEVGLTDCLKNSTNMTGSTSCSSLQEGMSSQICTVKVLEQPWLDVLALTEHHCSAGERERRDTGEYLVGAPHPTDVNDPYIQEIALFATSELTKGSDSVFIEKTTEIVSAHTQVVAGSLIRLVLRLQHTNCVKGVNDTDLESCEVQEGLEGRTCTVEVWDRPWLQERVVQSQECESAPSRERRRRSPKSPSTSDLFAEFMTRYNKSYDSNDEKLRRLRIFKANLRKIRLLQNTEQGTAIYGATQFADLSEEEFRKRYLGLNPGLRQANAVPLPHADIPNVEIPKAFDWRDHHAVTEVKDQGSCGSCWAFSVTGNVEGLYALHTGNLVSLSEQELVDCDALDQGCMGGLPSNAYRALHRLGGLETERDYPYEGVGHPCHLEPSRTRVRVRGGLNITTNETAMAQWLVRHGPLSAAINANAMQFYIGGISHPWKILCRGDEDDLDHGVLIVGYGVHDYQLFNRSLPFWTIKNSWGQMWGEQGYYRVYRGDGTCGINQMVTSAVLE